MSDLTIDFNYDDALGIDMTMSSNDARPKIVRFHFSDPKDFLLWMKTFLEEKAKRQKMQGEYNTTILDVLGEDMVLGITADQLKLGDRMNLVKWVDRGVDYLKKSEIESRLRK